MERSLAGRARVGRIHRPFAPPAPRRAVRPRARARAARGARSPRSLRLALRIGVIEQPPVAALVAGASRSAVAADGVVLGPALLSGSLPTVAAGRVPASGQRVSDASAGEALSVLGAAPAPLAGLVVRAYTGSGGL